MPGCAIDPHTHNHRRHPIANDDLFDRGTNYVDSNERPNHDGQYHLRSDVNQPVTVADLLDALRDAYDDNDRARDYFHLRQAADYSTNLAHHRIQRALDQYHALSPSERAEFDRRTT